jgi:hypothetical protein
MDKNTWTAALQAWCATRKQQCAMYQDHAPYYIARLQCLRSLALRELSRLLEHLAGLITTGRRPPAMQKIITRRLSELSLEDQDIVLGMLLVAEWDRLPSAVQEAVTQLPSLAGLRREPTAPAGLFCGLCIAWQLPSGAGQTGP